MQRRGHPTVMGDNKPGDPFKQRGSHPPSQLQAFASCVGIKILARGEILH